MNSFAECLGVATTHTKRSNIMAIDVADSMPDGWQRWLDWHRVVAPDNTEYTRKPLLRSESE